MNASTPRTPRRRAATTRRPPASRTPTSSAAAVSPATATPGRGSRGLFVDGQWFCDCTPRRPAALRETRKPGANRGRWFYTCPQDRRHQCSFFVWEDYAGAVQGGAAAAASAAVTPPSSARPTRSVPRPSYRTSIGRRTTPPSERHEEIRIPVTQLPLPPAPLPASSARRNRTFTTPTGGRLGRQYAVMEEEGGDDGDDDDVFHNPLPPTPTPARTRTGPSRPSALEAPAPAHEPPSQRITQYFGVVRRSDRTGGGSAEKPPDAAMPTRRSTRARSGVTGSRSAGPVAAAAPNRAASPVAKREASDYSDSDVDSDMERALVALADHSEQAVTRSRRGEVQETEHEKEDDDPDRMDADTDTDTRRPGNIVVPVPLNRRMSRTGSGLDAAAAAAAAAAAEATVAPVATAPAAVPPSPSPTPRRRRGLLIASDEYAAAATHHRDQRRRSPPPSVPATDSANTSFSSVFSRPPTWLASSQGTQASQASVATTAATTPPSSFRSSGVFGSSRGSGDGGGGGVSEYRTRSRDTRGRFSSDGAEDDDADNVNVPGEDDPFTSTPSRRVRFARDGRPSQPSLVSSPLSSRRTRRWDEDDDMHVDGEDENEIKHSPGDESQVDSHGDHPVTATVLQLLADQPVAPRVREKVRKVLNESFSS